MTSDIKTIRELIDTMAGTRPEATFLISPETGRELTFRGLQEQSRLLTAQLQQAGLERGDKVAFLLDNGLFTVQLFLGTMYGGFVSVPLNVRAGVSTLSYTLEHCDAKVVFVEGQYTALIKEAMANVPRAVQVIPADVDSCIEAAGTPHSTTTSTAPGPEDVALLMYSSGSTGQPKAAVHSHCTVLAQARNSICSHQLSAADRSLLVLPLYHINAECVSLGPALLSGGSVVVPHSFSVSRFWDWLEEWYCTWSALVPTIISQLLDWDDPRAGTRQAAFQRIRFLRSSSAPLSPSLHREFLDKFKLLLIQAMGSTEAGNIFSNPLPPGENKIGSPGLPWGFETRIVDPEGVEVPPGEPGEVLIRGPALMQGYYKDPQGTAAVLDPDGWFHSGDLAYRDAGGYFFVVGRAKELIIKGGMNIAPKQIDEVLESHPAVLEAAAVGVPDRYVGEDVVAFVVLRSGMASDEKELLTFCVSRLGHFKTPTRIHFVRDLPKGPSGKVQRLKLQGEAAQPSVPGPDSPEGEAALPGAGLVSQAGIEAALTPIEQTVARIWAELLAQPQVDVHTNFFSLGGHSLLAIQCLSRLREKLPVTLSLSDFFENATVAQQAALIRKRLCPDGRSPPGATAVWEQELLNQLGAPAADEVIPPRDRSRLCPLSPAQKRVWFFGQLVPDVPLYNESEAVRLRGKLNVEAMEQALNIIISRHEILRTTIAIADERPTAIVHESWPLKLKRIDLCALSADQRHAEIERLLVEEPRRPFHLQAEPGIRATLLRLSPEEHVFILMMHHLVCDWSSEGVIWRELAVCYRALTRGKLPVLPLLAIQHGDYAAWQTRQMNEGGFADDLAYWEENLRGAPPLLELPTDRPRPGVNTYAGVRQRFRMDSTLVQALRDCSRREKVSLFTLFTAALNTLLYRYTGQEDVLLGIPLADRDRPELQSVIGFLLHTHVLRTRLSGNLTFRELLARVKKGVLDLYAHRAAPFDQVVNKVQPERNLSYAPLFQVMINWRDREQQLSFIGLEGLQVESLLAESRTAKFDLILMLTDDGPDIWLEVEYRTDLFDPDRIVRLSGHYQTLLGAVAAGPDRRLADLPVLTTAEHQQLLVEWNDTAKEYPRDKCIHELFEIQVEETPEAVAVVYGEQQLTYRELNARANQLAHHLQAHGVHQGTKAGIYAERSLEMVIGLLGILKAGGAYVPLDPAYPKLRLGFMIEDTRIPVLLTLERLKGFLPENHAQLVCLDSKPGVVSEANLENPDSGATPNSLAYVIYTSGSTGKPKGTCIPHRAVVRLVKNTNYVSLTAQDVFFQFAPISFDASTFEIWGCLLNGGRLVVAPPFTPSLGELGQWIQQYKVTTLWLTAALFQQMAEYHLQSLSRVRQLLAGGETLPVAQVRKVVADLKGCQLTNGYGPTENTTFTCCYPVNDSSPLGKSVPIGRPIANTQVYVLDRQMQPVPVGIPGELYIGGDGLAQGYLNQPELTAEKFVSNPFNDKPGARLYRSGDLVQWLPDGNLEFLGRIDNQVKIRGFRIELGEIESVLEGHPGVREAVVVLREDVPGDKRLVAYFTAKGGDQPSASELRGLLLAKLPEYMVPAAIVILDRLPLTPNGKVDRKALPRPALTWPELNEAFVVPRTPVEEVLARIWCEILGLNQVGVHDNFFELGGHSLLATRIISRVRHSFAVDLPLRSLFESPTVEGMASSLLQLAGKPAELEKRAALLLRVAELSESEVDAMLAAGS